MTETTYNGWTNYETWNVKLWIDNDEGSSDYWLERARELLENPPTNSVWTERERAKYSLADELKTSLNENAPEVSGCYADLLNAALSEVDWDEIAESFIAYVEEPEA